MEEEAEGEEIGAGEFGGVGGEGIGRCRRRSRGIGGCGVGVRTLASWDWRFERRISRELEGGEVGEGEGGDEAGGEVVVGLGGEELVALGGEGDERRFSGRWSWCIQRDSFWPMGGVLKRGRYHWRSVSQVSEGEEGRAWIRGGELVVGLEMLEEGRGRRCGGCRWDWLRWFGRGSRRRADGRVVRW